MRSRTPFTPQPPQVVAKTVKYRPEQEHVLRRLGGALVLQWDSLLEALQDLIVDQAAMVDDRDDAPHEAGDIENFIRGAKVTALAKTQAADG